MKIKAKQVAHAMLVLPRSAKHFDPKIAGLGDRRKTHRCAMEGCTGARYHITWPDGERSAPCGKSLEYLGCVDVWRIE